jgi:hypothetical protein
VAGHALEQRRPPHYWPRGWPDHPLGRSGVDEPPPKGQKTKQKKKSLGWPNHPKGLGDGSTTPRSAVWGGRNHPQALGGGSATPKRPRNQKQNKKLGFESPPNRLYGVVETTPKRPRNQKQKKKSLGFEPPPYRPYGVVKTTPRPLGVVRPPSKPLTFFLFCFLAFWGWPVLLKGVASHSLSFFFFCFNIFF